MRSKQYFTSIKNNPHEISTDPIKGQLQPHRIYLIIIVIEFIFNVKKVCDRSTEI